MALSTDKAVWDAVMNNDVVQEFKRSFQDGMRLLDSLFTWVNNVFKLGSSPSLIFLTFCYVKKHINNRTHLVLLASCFLSWMNLHLMQLILSFSQGN